MNNNVISYKLVIYVLYLSLNLFLKCLYCLHVRQLSLYIPFLSHTTPTPSTVSANNKLRNQELQ